MNEEPYRLKRLTKFDLEVLLDKVSSIKEPFKCDLKMIKDVKEELALRSEEDGRT